MSAMRLINETSAPDGVLQVQVTDVFSNDFDIYYITFSDFDSNGVFGLDMRWINSSGAEIQSAQYDRAKQYMSVASSFGEVRSSNQTYIDRVIDMVGYSTANQSSYGSMWVIDPFKSTCYTKFMAEGGLRGSSNYTAVRDFGVLTELSSVAGFSVYSDDGTDTFKNLKIRTYGLAVK